MLSIIIPAHNEEQYIRLCLESIKQQKYRDYELIVVCDACTDKTPSIAKGYTKRVFSINKNNVSAARNYGAKKAGGEVLVFLDADSIIALHLLFEIEKAIQCGCIGGITKTCSLEPLWKAQLLWMLGNFFRHFFLAGSGIIFCKRACFNGFDESRKIAEDTCLLFALKKKGKLKYITNSFIKTSSRRWEREGYFQTIFKQYLAFFRKNSKGYREPSKNPSRAK